MDNQGLPTTMDVLQPAIVLLRPEQQGSLNNVPSTNETHKMHTDFWSENAAIYRLGKRIQISTSPSPSMDLISFLTPLN
jgi:hypothetical protein